MAYRDLDRPPLSAAALRSELLDRPGIWTDLIVVEDTDSTNADVARAARDGAPEGLIVTAERQHAGRGRLDRRWTMPEGSGLVVSVLLRPDVAASRWVWLPLLAGLAVDATVKECGVESGLKWPNDVLVKGRKIAGILLERIDSPAGPAAVIGVGLNVSMRAEELPVDTATSLLLEGATQVDRTVVLRAFLRNLEALYRAWSSNGGDPSAGIRDSYLARCVTVGVQVRVTMPDASVLQGTAETVDTSGRLVVDGVPVSAGDITHVRPIA